MNDFPEQLDESQSEIEQEEIKRLDKIENPVPAFSPQFYPPRDLYCRDFFNTFIDFTKNIIPKFILDPNQIQSNAIIFLRNSLDQEINHPIHADMMVRTFLISCNDKLVELMSNSSLTRISLLHHELFQCSEIIHNCHKVSFELDDYCSMLMADTADIYHSHFSELIEHKFWGKNKSVQELILTFLKKEFERLKLLNPLTYKTICTLAMKKSIDSAPQSSNHELISWARENFIPYE